MGYNSRITGMIPVAPAFNISLLPNQKFLPGALSQRSVGMGAVFHVEGRPVIHPVYGAGTALYVAGIIPASLEPIYATNLPQDLDEMAAQVIAAGSRCDVDAYLTRSGEEQGDLERFSFNEAEWTNSQGFVQTHQSEKAELRWPSDGTVA